MSEDKALLAQALDLRGRMKTLQRRISFYTGVIDRQRKSGNIKDGDAVKKLNSDILELNKLKKEIEAIPLSANEKKALKIREVVFVKKQTKRSI